MMETICKYFLYFIIYAFIGWLMEVCVSLWSKHKFINRGFLIGPYCPIYGWGSLAIILAVGKNTTDILAVFLKAILIFIIFYLSSLIQLIPIIIFKLDYDKLSGSNKMNLSLFSDICLLILLLIYYRKDIIKDIKDFFKNINNYMDTGFKYWLLGLLGMILSNFIILSIIPSAKTVNEETVQGMIRSSLPIISLLMIGIIGPIIEELVFRKSFKKAFNNKYLFIIGTGLFFGATHIIFSLNSLFDLFYIIPYSFLGIAFGIIYYKTNNISVSIMMHIIHNTLLTIISIGGLGLIIW